jgi:hypothetical protein
MIPAHPLNQDGTPSFPMVPALIIPIQVFDAIGSRVDVGRTTRINLSLGNPIKPKFNRPEKAYQGGITDWRDKPCRRSKCIDLEDLQF